MMKKITRVILFLMVVIPSFLYSKNQAMIPRMAVYSIASKEKLFYRDDTDLITIGGLGMLTVEVPFESKAQIDEDFLIFIQANLGNIYNKSRFEIIFDYGDAIDVRDKNRNIRTLFVKTKERIIIFSVVEHDYKAKLSYLDIQRAIIKEVRELHNMSR